MTFACHRASSEALAIAASSTCAVGELLSSLKQIEMSSFDPAASSASAEKVVAVARIFRELTEPGHPSGLADDPEQLSTSTTAYCSVLRQFNMSGVYFSHKEQLAAVLEPLIDICQMATSQISPGNVFISALATCVDTVSHNSGHLDSETIASMVQVSVAHLPTTPLKFNTMDSAAASVAAVAGLCNACAASMHVAQAQQCLASAAQALHAVATSSPPADEWHAKMLSNLLSALSVLASRPSLHLRDSNATLLDALTVLWTFGIPVARKVTTTGVHTAQPLAPGSPASKYMPPWRRSSQRSSSDAADTSPYSSDASVSSRREVGSGLRVRIASIKLLTTCLQQFPTALHLVWDRLLPHSNATLPSARPRSLLGVLLHDPSATMRTAAAVALQAMLTGPKNAAFVRVARSAGVGPQRRSTASTRLQPARAFMPLSESLALMVQAIHSTLAIVLQREAMNEVVLESLKAADLLMQHAPYQNLSPDLAQEIVNACAASWNAVDARPDAQGSLSGSLTSPQSPRQDAVPKRCAILSLLATAARSSAPLSLPTLAVTNPVDRAAAHTADLLVVLMACAAPGGVHPAIQWEACGVLRALCQHRAAELQLRWPDVQALVWAHVSRVAEVAEPGGPGAPAPLRRAQQSTGPSASMPEKVANQAVRLAGDFASASCKLACEADLPNRTQCLVSLALDFTASMSACADQAGAPAIRSAAYAALGAAPSELWAALPGDLVAQEVRAMQRAVVADAVPAVRSHAVAAAAAALSHSSSFAQSQGAWLSAAEAILKASSDTAASVRVAAAAALARVCAHLRMLVGANAGDAGAVVSESRVSKIHQDSCGGVDQAGPEHGGGAPVVPMTAVLLPEAWRLLREAVLSAARGGEKTSVHGLRAVGCLAALLPVQETLVADAFAQAVEPVLEASRATQGPLEADEVGAWSVWLADALPMLRHGLSSGSAKSAWNACTAASLVFSNSDGLRGMAAPEELQDLHAAVLAALQQSQNFKVRIHAARALHAAGAAVCREGVGGMLPRVMAALRAVEAEGGSGGAPAGGASTPAGGVGKDEDAAAVAVDTGKPDPAAHFRYHAELQESLAGVLTDLLAACTAGELLAAAGDLEWVLDFLDAQVAAWSVLSVPEATSEPGELEGRQYMTQEATLRGDVEEVAVRGAALHLVIPPMCASISAAVGNVHRLARDGSVPLSQAGATTLARLHAMLVVSSGADSTGQ